MLFWLIQQHLFACRTDLYSLFSTLSKLKILSISTDQWTVLAVRREIKLMKPCRYICVLSNSVSFPLMKHKDTDLKHTHTRIVSLCPGKCVLIFELNLFHTGGESLMSPQAELLRGRLVAELWLCGGMFCLVALWTTTDRGESTVQTSATLRGDAQAAFWGEKISHGGREGGIEGGKEIAV